MNGGRILGVKNLVNRVKAIAKKFPDRVAAALYREGQIEMTESKRRCPVWNPARPVPPGHAPGTLRASGRVAEPVRNGRKLSVTLSYGTPYAIFVHEDLEAFHATGQAKYLESVLNESRSSMAARLAARLHMSKEA